MTSLSLPKHKHNQLSGSGAAIVRSAIHRRPRQPQVIDTLLETRSDSDKARVTLYSALAVDHIETTNQPYKNTLQAFGALKNGFEGFCLHLCQSYLRLVWNRICWSRTCRINEPAHVAAICLYVFWRITLFDILSIRFVGLLVGLLVSSTDERLRCAD